MNLAQIVAVLPFYHTDVTVEHLNINSIHVDSREVTTGDLFICIKGFTVDGHDFAKQAVEHGAVAVIAERALDLSVPTIIVPDTTRALARSEEHTSELQSRGHLVC